MTIKELKDKLDEAAQKHELGDRLSVYISDTDGVYPITKVSSPFTTRADWEDDDSESDIVSIYWE